MVIEQLLYNACSLLGIDMRQKISILCSVLRGPPTLFFLRSTYLHSSSLIPFRPLMNQPSHFVRRQTISFLLATSPSIQDEWLALLQKDFLLLLSIVPSRPSGSSSFPVSANSLYWHIWESDQITFLFCQLVIRTFSLHNEVINIGWENRDRISNADTICSYNTFVLPRSVWACSQMYNFHSKMDFWSACQLNSLVGVMDYVIVKKYSPSTPPWEEYISRFRWCLSWSFDVLWP